MGIALTAESKQKAAQVTTEGFLLPEGKKLPAIGFGTYDLSEGDACAEAVVNALHSGYRLIDGAAFYGNEISVGKGIARSEVPRSEIFVTSKVWIANLGYQLTMDSFFKSLRELDLEYMDLFLIHWPASPNLQEHAEELNLSTWKAMTELYQEGYVRYIGVSNFKQHHLEPLLDAKVIPMVNQIEFHPGYSQLELVQFTQSLGMCVEGWSPFGRGAVLNHPLINSIAKEHNKSAAQVCLRYAHQLGVTTIPKSNNVERMQANLDIFDFELTTSQMEQILALDSEKLGFSGEDPDLTFH